jgi:hypothetical protein
MSFLRGPLTRDQIRKLTGVRPTTSVPVQSDEPSATPAAHVPPAAPTTGPVPTTMSLPPATGQLYVQLRQPPGVAGHVVYRPALLGSGRLHFIRAGYGVDHWEERRLLYRVEQEPDERLWEQAQAIATPLSTQPAAEPDAQVSALPASLTLAKSYAQWQQRLKDYLYSHQPLEILHCVALKEYSRAGETEADFRIRLTQLAREQRDQEVEKLRGRYASKLATLQERIRRAQDAIDREGSEYNEQKVNTAISVGASIFGAIFGRKVLSQKNIGRASSTARRAGRVARERKDVEQARETLDALLQQRAELEQQIADDVARINSASGTDRLQLERLQLPPRKADITVEPVTLVWMPWLVDDTGTARPAC